MFPRASLGEHDDDVAAVALPGWKPREPGVVESAKPGAEASITNDAPEHRRQLMAAGVQAWEVALQAAQVAEAPRRFVGGASLARVGEPLPGEGEQAIAALGFADDGTSARSQHAGDLRRGAVQVEMMQDGVAPDAVECPIGEGKPLAVAGDEIDLDGIAFGAPPGLAEIAGGQVAGDAARVLAGQHDRRHAMPAPQIEHAHAGGRAQLAHRRGDPAFVVKILLVVDKIIVRGQARRSLGRLPIVKLALASQSIRRHGASRH